MYDVTIIGAGIVGLATAWRLLEAKPGLKVAVVDKENTVAAHQSSHNSGVIHSGIYYKPGSMKALNCREGYEALLIFCREHGIPHEVCGKVIVATRSEEKGMLDRIFQRGIANGMKGIEKIGPEALKEIEPHAAGIEAIWVPQAGIISYKIRRFIQRHPYRIEQNGRSRHAEFLSGREQKDVPCQYTSSFIQGNSQHT